MPVFEEMTVRHQEGAVGVGGWYARKLVSELQMRGRAAPTTGTLLFNRREGGRARRRHHTHRNGSRTQERAGKSVTPRYADLGQRTQGSARD